MLVTTDRPDGTCARIVFRNGGFDDAATLEKLCEKVRAAVGPCRGMLVREWAQLLQFASQGGSASAGRRSFWAGAPKLIGNALPARGGGFWVCLMY